jgi:hypothetical protein
MSADTAGTVRIFVNGTEMTEGTDYTVDLENNCGDGMKITIRRANLQKRRSIIL